MMSHPRSHKAAVSGDRCNTRARVESDVLNNNDLMRRNQQPGSKSKNKPPKSVRYDLENALVGLCDIWFENIKPNLIRNNIKVHVHDVGTAEGCGDHDRLPTGALGCSHLDPGAALDHLRQPTASCVASCPTRLTVLKAQSTKPEVSYPRHLQTHPTASPLLQTHISIQNPRSSKKKKRSLKAHTYSMMTPPQFQWRVPRLCRTNSALSSPVLPRHQRGVHTVPAMRMPKPYTHQSPNQKRVRFKSQSTQIESFSKNKIQPIRLKGPHASNLTRQPESCPAHTDLAGSKKGKHAKESNSNIDGNILFKNDLIEIIGEKYDKKIKCLFKNPTIAMCPSVMNLASSPIQKADWSKKIKPWR